MYNIHKVYKVSRRVHFMNEIKTIIHRYIYNEKSDFYNMNIG